MKIKSNCNGFTIIELMIATTVFSIVLLLSSMIFIQINKYYTKSINTARMQNQARNIVSDVGNQLQLTSVNIIHGGTDTEGYYCIGNKRYDYKINVPEGDVVGGVTQHSLRSYDISNKSCNNIADLQSKVLLANDTRLLVFNIETLDQKVYNINMKLLFTSDTVERPDIIDNNDGPYDTWKCKEINEGGEYCAITGVSTSVLRRIQSE